MKNPVKESYFSSLPLEEQTIIRKTYKRMGPIGDHLLTEMLGNRNLRGGGWDDYDETVDTYGRSNEYPRNDKSEDMGFRIVRTKKNEKSSKR